MREDDSNWFAKWEEELPAPDELMPLSQTLITPNLAIAFDIRNPIISGHLPPPPPPVQATTSSLPNSSDFDSADLGSGAGGGGDEPARTLKRPRLVWTPQLHKRFVDAVAHLGIKNAVPKTIMQLMSVDGLTRENVASHLQKYRLYLKRMQGLSNSGGAGAGGFPATGDPATDHLFASSPVPAHFLHPTGRPNSDNFMPFMPVATLQQHHHHQQQQQMAVAVAGHHHQLQPHYRQMGQFGSPPTTNGQFEHPFLNNRPSSQLQGVRMMGGPIHNSISSSSSSYIDDNGRKVLTLFPTGDD